jgi:hypothetical protein
VTEKGLVERVLNDPATRAELEADPWAQERQRLYDVAAEGLIADLVAAGFPRLRQVQQLRQLDDYRAAVPVLVEWLPKVSYFHLAEDIVRTLDVPAFRKEAVPTLVRLFENPPELEDPMREPDAPPLRDLFRTTIGVTLGDLLSPAASDDALRLATDRSYGEARGPLVAALPKTKDERVPGILLELLDDPVVTADAVQALGKLRFTAARQRIEGLLTSNDRNVRDQAKKALKRLA